MNSLCETCDKEVFFKCPKYKPESSNKARCRICGKVLEGKQNKYCSKECAYKATKMSYRAGKPQKTCVICGAKMPYSKQKYCSKSCFNKGQNMRYRERKGDNACRTD